MTMSSQYLNQMRLVRMNKDGEIGDCQLLAYCYLY